MFYGSTHTIRLNSIDNGSSNITREYRIFRIIFKIPSTKWIPMNVHTRTQNHINTVFCCLCTHGVTDCIDQFLVPSRSQQSSNWKCGTVVCSVFSFSFRFNSQACWAIRQIDSRNTQSRGCNQGSYSARNSHARFVQSDGRTDSRPLEEVYFLFQSH